MAAPRARDRLGDDTPWHAARLVRRGAACGLETRASIDALCNLEESHESHRNEIKNKLRINKKKAKQKAAVETAESGVRTFLLVVVVLMNNFLGNQYSCCCFACFVARPQKEKKSLRCLQSDVRLEVSVQVKLFTYDVT